MHASVTLSDPDRRIDFRLAVVYTFRSAVRPRIGWRDGGSCGEPAAIELERVRCLELVVWCGPFAVSARIGDEAGRRVETLLGRWCWREYAAEIEDAIANQIQTLRDLPRVVPAHPPSRKHSLP